VSVLVKTESLLRVEENNTTLLCFTKFNWFFQDECMMCETITRCEKATREKRLETIEKINVAINNGMTFDRAYKIIHPNILDRNYNF
jgi:hypothetical protein